jgi:phosphoribosyl-ATP pyrophosphohydrolase/phosphoribosyl-AMP cyclohydrolase
MAEIDFEKMQGLVPAIIQDANNGEMLMLGFVNRDAWRKTLESGYMTFYSRTRNELWMKGETSGNRLKVISAFTDCDRDSLLIHVEVEGAGIVCHEGTRSCFTKPIVPTEILFTYPLKSAKGGADSKPVRQDEPVPHVQEPAQ